MPAPLMKTCYRVCSTFSIMFPSCPNYLYTALRYIVQKQVDKSLFEPHTIACFLQAFNRWGYYPLILIGSWAFATINRLYDFANPGHRIVWLSFLDVGFAGLMVSLLMLVFLY
jgi:hypothetical protein